ncbi:hypothetical protein D9M69_343010 [compost metagenome]
MFQPGTAECHAHVHAQQMVGVRTEDLVVRAGLPSLRWLARRPAEGLQFGAAVVPEHRHQRQDEVRLVELFPFAVDAHENVGHLLLGALLRELQRDEGEVGQPCQTADSLSDAMLLTLGNLTIRTKPVQVARDELVGVGSEHFRDVYDELWVALSSCVRHSKGAALRSEGDADVLAFEILTQHRLAADNGVKRGQPLLAIYNQQ